MEIKEIIEIMQDKIEALRRFVGRDLQKACYSAIDILRKVESGELVEIVRCKDCANTYPKRLVAMVNPSKTVYGIACRETNMLIIDTPEHWCSKGKRKDSEVKEQAQ